MVRRALLVGAETFELVGVGEDVAVVEATLRGGGSRTSARVRGMRRPGTGSSRRTRSSLRTRRTATR